MPIENISIWYIRGTAQRFLLPLVFGLALSRAGCWAELVDVAMATKAAEGFIRQEQAAWRINGRLRPGSLQRQDLDSAPTIAVADAKPISDADGNVLFYVLDLDPMGYIVVSADTDYPPIQGFSFGNGFPYMDHPDNALLHYVTWSMEAQRFGVRGREEASVQIAQANELEQWVQKNHAAWAETLGEVEKFQITSAGRRQWPESDGGWIQDETWHQGSPYNRYCPVKDPTDLGKGRFLVGCGGTAVAQVVNYWRYPESIQFDDEDSYRSDYYSDQGAPLVYIDEDAALRHFPSFSHWNRNLSALLYDGTDEFKGRLSFAAAVAMQMQFDMQMSGSFSVRVPFAFTDEFKFDKAVAQENYGVDSSIWSDYKPQIVNNLKKGWPVVVAIMKRVFSDGQWQFSGNSGHFIIFEGYRDDGAICMNFGWGEGKENAGAWLLVSDMRGFNLITAITYDITPYPAPIILANPPPTVTVNKGQSLVLDVHASSKVTPTYQWKKGDQTLSDNGGSIQGARSTQLVLNNIQTSDAGGYYVIVSNRVGSATSQVSILTVNVPPEPPQITVQPQSLTLAVGAQASFTVGASGTSPLSYQWFFGNNPLNDSSKISGSKTATLSVQNVQASDVGNYHALVSNAAGSISSKEAVLGIYTDTLEETLGLSWATVTTTGASPWFGQNQITHDGISAAQSGKISHNQQSVMTILLSGPGTISFWWKVSSELNADMLEYLVDGTKQAQISGEADWRKVNITLTTGNHTIQWRYAKNGSGSSGRDCGWVDELAYVTGGSSAVLFLNNYDLKQPICYGSVGTMAPVSETWVQILAGPVGGTLSPLSDPFPLVENGFFDNGYAIVSGAAANGRVHAQVRAWLGTDGSRYETATDQGILTFEQEAGANYGPPTLPKPARLAMTGPLIITRGVASGTAAILLNNYDANQPICLNSSQLASAANTWVQVFAGPPAGDLQPLTQPLRLSEDGFFDYGNAKVPGAAANSQIQVQLKAWQGSLGSLFETATVRGSVLFVQTAGADFGAPSLPTPATLNLKAPLYLTTGASGSAAILLNNYDSMQPIYYLTLGTKAPVIDTWVQVFAGPVGSALAPVSDPFGLTEPGFFDHSYGNVPDAAANSLVQVQIKAWRGSQGATFEEALEKGTLAFTQTAGSNPGAPTPPTPAALTMPGPLLIKLPGPFTLTTNVVGSGYILLEPAKQKYAYNEIVKATAVEAINYGFVQWSGATSSINKSISLRMDGNKALTAAFQRRFQMIVRTTGQGTVTRDPDQSSYSAGSRVTLWASSSAGYVFAGWSGAITGNSNPATIIVNGDITVNANFAGAWTLNTLAENGGRILRNPDLTTYSTGQTVVLTAVPNAGFRFAGWGRDAAGTSNPISITMTANRTVSASFLDATAPVVKILEPTSGIAASQIINMRGTIVDNLPGSITARWEQDGKPQTNISLVNGLFAISNVKLRAGVNTLRVVGRDATGNEGDSILSLNWKPERVLILGDAREQPEGHLLTTPLSLISSGEVGGMTFVITYDPDFLQEPVLTWSGLLGSALCHVDYAAAGQIRGTFSLPAQAIPAGTQLIAQVTFRARSVPFDLKTGFGLEVLDVATSDGEQILAETDTEAGSAQITRRLLTGDNNANDRIDIGDATLLQKLLTQVNKPREWDVRGNDLNNSGMIDSGDVIKILRIVAGIDPHPKVNDAGLAGGFIRYYRVPVDGSCNDIMAAGLGEAALLMPSMLAGKSGDSVTFRIELANLNSTVSGISYVLEYPTNALRIPGTSSLRTGSLVPTNALVI